MNIQTWGLSIV